MTPELKDKGYDVGERVVRKLMKFFGIRLKNNTNKIPQSEARKLINSLNDGFNVVKKLTDINPFQVFYTDYSEILYDKSKKKAYLMALIDHAGKLVPGYALEERKNMDTELKAINRAASMLKELGHTFKDKIKDHPPGPGSCLIWIQVDERGTNKSKCSDLLLGERSQRESLYRGFSQQFKKREQRSILRSKEYLGAKTNCQRKNRVL